jgi:hypothetical protein
MLKTLAPLALLGLVPLAPLRAQDSGYWFNAAARITISRTPFYPDINFYGALQMRDLQFPVANPDYKAWWQITMVPEDPTVAAQLAGPLGRVATGHVTATGTRAGHMILQFSTQMGAWQIDITPFDSTLRQYIAASADNPNLNGDAGVQSLSIVVGSDSMSITAIQLAGTEGQQFFWQRPRQ